VHRRGCGATPSTPAAGSRIGGLSAAQPPGGTGQKPAADRHTTSPQSQQPIDVTALTVPSPRSGSVLFGVHLAWDTDTPAGYIARSGLRPAVYGDFLTMPPTPDELATLTRRANSAAQVGASLFLTLEPTSGLKTVTPTTARAMATVIADLNRLGVGCYLRFAHEMNGGWYPWSQQPRAYVAAFRVVADAIHRYAPGNQMVWSPNYGGGYPFTGGRYTAKPGSADFAVLDTNHDQVLDMSDDMYTPFYPGDRYVDWVGLTLYYFGRHYPWGANTVPDRRFIAQLTGGYNGTTGDERGIPNFYQRFAVAHNKPMAISETGAFFNTSRTKGAAEAAIKNAWIAQVYDAANARRFPRLNMINWFEHRKFEQEARGVVDWRLTFAPAVLRELVSKVDHGRYVFGR
jgi:hypothetical protein